MKEHIKLDDFYMTELHVDFNNSGDKENLPPENPWLDYNVLRNPDNDRQFALVLCVKSYSEMESSSSGYLIESEIQGIFSFSEESSEEEMQYLIRINGANILYGILRGQIAATTGTFPNGKFVLPAVYMHKVLPEIDKRKKPTTAKAKKAKMSKKTISVTKVAAKGKKVVRKKTGSTTKKTVKRKKV
jgi:preprotein translocase subunit SecB